MDEEVTKSVNELSEEKARAGGWVNQDEWQGAPEDWVDSHQFNLRGELMGRIQNQTRQLRQYEREQAELRQALVALGEHNKLLAEVQYEKFVQELKGRKKAALEADAHDEVMEIDEQIMQAKAEQAQLKALPQDTQQAQQSQQANIPPELPEAFRAWTEKNAWYHTDKVRQTAANVIGDELIEKNPGIGMDELFRTIDRRLREEFPHKFKSPTSSTPSVDDNESGVRSKGPSPKGGKKFTSKDLTSEERRVMKSFVDSKVMTEEEYLKQYADIKGFEGPRLGE